MPAPVTLQRARQLFGLCNARLCCPASAPAPCIPFLYPDNGCWARAHEMCRLMIADGADPEKVWIYGGLNVSSRNKPNCLVTWGWHVAPTLQVQIGSSIQTYVIDPSLFDEPVTEANWKLKQGDTNAVLIASAASVYYRNKTGTYTTTDPGYTQTNTDLNTYRNALKVRVSTHGPPPFFACMTKPPGTQWMGTIPGNATQNWFTWGWPASWHVVWNIMPLTPCPGGPQLDFNVRVERASTAHCTHWITVKNLTADPIQFEGRYDVLST